MWLALAVGSVLLGWYWIGPLVQGWLFNEDRLLLLATVFAASLVGFSIYLRRVGIAGAGPPSEMGSSVSNESRYAS
jgi:hypothetical protein